MAIKKKPFGLVAIAVYAGFSGIIFLPAGLLFLLAGQAPKSSGIIFTVCGILSLVLGVILLAAAFGLWSLQEWGRKVTFWVSLAIIPLGIISIFPIFPDQKITVSNTVLQLVGIGLSLLIMFYLSRARIRALFGVDETEANV